MDLRRERRPTSKVQALADEEEARRSVLTEKARRRAENEAKRHRLQLEKDNAVPTPMPSERTRPPVEADNLIVFDSTNRPQLTLRPSLIPPTRSQASSSSSSQRGNTLSRQKVEQLIAMRTIRQAQDATAWTRRSESLPSSPRLLNRSEFGSEGDSERRSSSGHNPERGQYGSGSGRNSERNQYNSEDDPDPEQDEGQGGSDMEGSSHKRRHEDRDDSEIGPQRKAKRVEAAERRPKARDFEVDVQDVISAAIAHYRTELSTKNAYPDMTTEVNWARAAWKAGCHDKDVEITPNSDVLRLITARSSHLRGDVKIKAKDVVASVYKFQHSTNRNIISSQRVRVEELKHEYAYTYRKIGPQKAGFMKSRAIQDVINRIWFRVSAKSQPDALVFRDQYEPFPLVAVALTLSAIECALDEWRNGSYNAVPFTSSEYKPIFDDALQMLKKFDEDTKEHKILPHIQNAIFSAGCVYAQFDPDDGPNQKTISNDAVKQAIEEYQNGVRWSDDDDSE